MLRFKLNVILVGLALVAILAISSWLLYLKVYQPPLATTTNTNITPNEVELVILQRNKPTIAKQSQLTLVLSNHTFTANQTMATEIIIRQGDQSLGVLSFNQIGSIQYLAGYAFRLVNAALDSVQVIVAKQY